MLGAEKPTVDALFPDNVKTKATINYEAAYKEHQETGKPLVVVIAADWCTPCQDLKTNVFPRIFKKIKRHKFCYAEVNWDREPAQVRLLTTSTTVPQVIIFYKLGKMNKRVDIIGVKEKEIHDFLEKLQELK